MGTCSIGPPCFLDIQGMGTFSTVSFYPSGWRGDRSCRGWGPLFWTPLSYDSWPQALPDVLAPAAAELWHQEVLPGMAPSSRWGSAYARVSLALSIPRAALRWAGPMAQHPQNRGAQAFFPLPCWPCLSPGLPFPCPSLTISNVVTILRPYTAAADSVGDAPVESVWLCLLFAGKPLCPSLQMVMGQAPREPLGSLAIVSGARH